MDDIRVIEGDCLAVLAGMEAGSVDAVVTDPPYPCIRRDYGTWTEEEWWALMRPVVRECMRLLKPAGSAVFVLQPNSERVGRMRTWLWDFMAWVGREWGIVQDAWWWNISAMPLGGACRGGLMRPSLKACVWVGPAGCWRGQEAVLMEESEHNRLDRILARHKRDEYPSRRRSETEGPREHRPRLVGAAARRGGTTPFNVLPAGSDGCAGSHGHGAGTPLALMRWWTRYICPPGGTVLDPFAGSGTAGLAAIAEGRQAILVERHPPYVEIIKRRLADAAGPLFAPGASA